MNSIRLKITIDLNQNHALNFQDLKAMKPIIARGIAACLPDSISVDTIRVTSVKETKPRSVGKQPETTQAMATMGAGVAVLTQHAGI